MEHSPIGIFFAAFVFLALGKWWIRTSGLRSIPTVGPSAPLLSYIGAHRLVNHAREMLKEGYEKYKGGMFKLAMQDRWLVVVNTPELIEELRKLPDDQVSFIDAVHETIDAKYTFGQTVFDDPYYIDIVKAHVLRHSGELYPFVLEEMEMAFKEQLPSSMSDWTSIPALAVAQKVVSRTSNRVFVGIPLCRDPAFVDLSIRHTIDVSNTRKVLSQFPGILRRVVAPFANHAAETFRTASQCLLPIVKERLARMEDPEIDQSGEQIDLLQRAILETKSKKYDPEAVVQVILAIEFASIHTSSNSFTHMLFHLAAQPEYMKPLRDEIELAVREDGWNKESLSKMHRLDSFMRESQRINGIGFTHVLRKLLTPVTFSNGITLPEDTYVAAPVSAIHYDTDRYQDPAVFHPWRFFDMREASNGTTKYQYVTPSIDYLAFGHGKHACPGRFFAANEIKSMLAYIIMRYDVKFAEEGVRPPNHDVFLNTFPSPGVEVLFRDRRDI